MRRTILIGFVAVGLLAGCNPQPAGPRQVAVPPGDPNVRPVSNVLPPKGPAAPGDTIDDILAAATRTSGQDQVAVALTNALDLLARKKTAEALAALNAAKQTAKDAGQDTDAIDREIGRVQDAMAREAAADATAQSIRAVLDDGRAEEASRLAAAALAQYGGSDAADELLKLKREADALAAAQAGAGRRNLRDEIKADLAANNLRAAAAALEQAVGQGDDEDAKKQLADIHDRLARYDDERRRAEELRRDPATLDDAVAALQEAQKAWDTPDVQQQIADYQLALQNRRDRVGVADFEVRGDVGLADAGGALADELLPAFKSRFDLVERGQVSKAAADLKLEAGDLNDGRNQGEVGRLAKLRYLVVGDVTRLGGVTINARLMDVRSGLVVQTARISAPTAAELTPLLPQLAAVLMMTDDQKLAYEQQVAKLDAPPAPASGDPEPLPPPPDVRPDDQPPPPPVVTAAPLPPPPGDITPVVFDNLPPPPPPDQPPVVVIEDPADAVVKVRVRHVCIDLGDHLFRCGRFRDAQVQFELALNAGCDPRDIEVRLDRCRPFLPPPPEIVVILPPRPRLAILDLAVIGDPDVVPPVLGPWTADNLAPYFAMNYDVVDRQTVCWYMNRLGLSLRDVLTDPVARRWLGRALGVRFFVLGEVRETASFVVTTHLVDAEWGYDYGWGKVHVHNPFELRLRLGDLAAETQLDPGERRRRHEDGDRERERLAQQAEADRLVLEARNNGDSGDLTVSIELLGRARDLRPDSIEIAVLLGRFNERQRRREWEENRKHEWEGRQGAQAAAQQQQLELARAAEEARAQAAREAAGRQAAEAQLLEQQRRQAVIQLQAQAQLALAQQQFDQAIQLYQSALAIRQTDELFRSLAEARAQAGEAARLAAGRQAEAVQRQRDEDVANARRQLAEQRRKQEEKEQAERTAQEAHDKALYQRLLDDARAELAKEQFDAAISSLEAARQLERTDELQKLLSRAQQEKARAAALKKDPGGAAELDRQAAEDKERRQKADADAANNRERYDQALKLADKALAEKNYDVAEAKYQDAGKVFNTDAVVAGLRKVKDARVEAAAEQVRRDAEAKKDADFRRLSQAGFAALKVQNYDLAMTQLGNADRLKPGDVDVLAALGKAQDGAARAKRDADAAQRDKAFHQFLDGGKTNLAAKQYGAAVSALKEAVQLKPDDKDAAAALAQAEKGQADAALNAEQQAEAAKKMEAYKKAMTDGRAALSARQYDAAATAFGEAQKLLPGDAASATFLKQAQQAKADADAAVAAAAKKQADEAARAALEQKALAQARKALAAHDLDAATKAVAAAADSALPNDPEVVKIQEDLKKAQTAATADADAKKKRAEQVQALLKKGADAQTAQRYDDAVQAFAEAGRLAPDDATVKDLLAKAQKARTDAQATADQAAAKKAAAERAAKVSQFVADARTALAKQDYDKAGQLLADARKLAPDDPAALKAQDDLAKASKETADRLKKQQDDYSKAMTAGRTASLKGDYEGAVASYTAALKAIPNDKDAASALQGAQQAKATADADAAKKADATKRRDQYAKLMEQGQAAMTAKQYADAAKAFGEALKVLPDDKAAARSLQDANQAAADAARTDADRKKREAAYADAMKTGRDAMTAKQYSDAVKAFALAQQQMPDDKAAAAGLKDAKAALDGEGAAKKLEADFAAYMKAGRDALTAKKYADAAKAYADAARLKPTDKDAAAGLKAAQDGTGADEKAKLEAAKRQEDLNRLLKQGQAAMTTNKYADAAQAFGDALKIDPTDATATKGLRDANAGLDAAKTDAEKKKREADYTSAMAAGKAAMTAKKYDDAVKAFADAGKIMAGDKAAADALKAAQDAAAADAKKKMEEAKKREDFNKVMAQAQTALAANRYDDAVKLFGDAAKMDPTDPGAAKGLQDAQTAQAKAGDAEKKRQAAYADAMKAGRDALTAKKYDDAVKAFGDAGKILVGDKAAADALKAAQDAAAADAKKKMEEAKKREDFNKVIAQAQTALAANRYDDAAKFFGDATKLDPTDPGAAKGLQAAQAAQAKAADAEKKRAADYAAAMAGGKAALTAKKYDDAIKAFSDAGKIMPGDKDAAASLKAAQDAAAADAAKKAEEAKKQADFANQMTAGQTALAGKKYDDAAKAYTAALQLQPADAKATAGLQSAQFGQHMAAGQALSGAKKFADAVKEFQAALAIMPDNPDAKAALKRAMNNMP